MVADLADAQASIADYFDYYNHDRLHSSITGPPHIVCSSRKVSDKPVSC